MTSSLAHGWVRLEEITGWGYLTSLEHHCIREEGDGCPDLGMTRQASADLVAGWAADLVADSAADSFESCPHFKRFMLNQLISEILVHLAFNSSVTIFIGR
jgi:hypothetical protein